MARLNLLSPWELTYKKIQAFFEKDSSIKVCYDDIEQEIKLYVSRPEKADALEKLLIPSYTFGNITVNVTVIPCNEVVKLQAKKFPVSEDTSILFTDALSLNSNFVKAVTLEGIFTNPITYIIFTKNVIQYYTDDLGDAYGLRTTLMQEIAKEIFKPQDNVFYCTTRDIQALETTSNWKF